MRLFIGAVAGTALLSGAVAYDSADRFQAADLCDVIAGYTVNYPSDMPGRAGLWERDGFIRQGRIDLDGDGKMEIVTNGDMGRNGGDLFDIARGDGDSILEGANVGGVNEPHGFGAGFTNFDGRWYMVVFARESGALVTGAFTFESGSLRRQLACRFDNAVTEIMALPDPNAIDDGTCPGLTEKVVAGRLKPVGQLTDAQFATLQAALMEESGGYVDQAPFTGVDLYKPTIGPFAGATLWKARLDSDAGIGGCHGEAFIALTPAGDGYTLTGGDVQTKLNVIQNGEADYPFGCAVDVQLSEADGQFYVERKAGGEPIDADEQLHHSVWAEADGQPKELCRARYEITPKVTWRAGDKAP